MNSEDFNRIWDQDEEGVRSANHSRTTQLRSDFKKQEQTWKFALAGIVIGGGMTLYGSSKQEIFATFAALGFYIVARQLDQARQAQLDMQIEIERLKGSIRDNRWLAYSMKDEVIARIDEADPRNKRSR